GGSRIVQYLRMRAGDVEQYLLCLARIVAISDADLDDQTRRGIRQRPVDEPIGDETLVRHHDFLVVPIHDRRRARADARDDALDIPDADDVADTERTFEQHDQSG